MVVIWLAHALEDAAERLIEMAGARSVDMEPPDHEVLDHWGSAGPDCETERLVAA